MKVSIAERIFNVVRDTPGLTEENVHEVMSVDVKYKTASGKSIIYRMLRAKYIRKDKNGRLHAHIEAYKPLPPYKAKKKKPVNREAVLAEAAKLNQIAQYQAASDQLGKTIDSVVAALVQVQPKPVTGGFLGGLGRRIGAYFR